MDYKKSNAPLTTVTRNLYDMDNPTGNLYQTVAIVAKRANQISVQMKQELNIKLEEFTSFTDNLEEVFENREQIEIAKYYEQLPKATLLSIHEWMHGMIYYRNPVKEESGSNF